jgi:hypothetical protein
MRNGAIPTTLHHYAHPFSLYPNLAISRVTHSHTLSCPCLTHVAPTIFCPTKPQVRGVAHGAIRIAFDIHEPL